MLEFVILGLATYRLSILLIHDDGPWAIIARFRDLIGVGYDEYSQPLPRNELAKLFTCIYCLSFWVGQLMAWGDPLEGLALSGATIILYNTARN